jgi:lipopolysaccharide export system permease protein
MIREQMRSPRATFAAPGWQLESPRRFDVAGTDQAQLAAYGGGQGLTPAEVTISKVDADAQNIFSCPARSRR